MVVVVVLGVQEGCRLAAEGREAGGTHTPAQLNK